MPGIIDKLRRVRWGVKEIAIAVALGALLLFGAISGPAAWSIIEDTIGSAATQPAEIEGGDGELLSPDDETEAGAFRGRDDVRYGGIVTGRG